MNECSTDDLIALISEKNAWLRRRCEDIWNETQTISVTASEWSVLSRLQGGRPSVSEMARWSHISRQASHKSLKSLAEKGLLEVVEDPENRRCKKVCLTPLGTQCWECYAAIRIQLEQQVAQSIGAENVQLLKQQLQKDW